MSIISSLKRLITGANVDAVEQVQTEQAPAAAKIIEVHDEAPKLSNEVLAVTKRAQFVLDDLCSLLRAANLSKTLAARESKLQIAHGRLNEIKKLAKKYPYVTIENMQAVEDSFIALENSLIVSDITDTNSKSGSDVVQSETFGQAVNISMGAGGSPSPGYLRSLSSNAMIDEAPTADFWAQQDDVTHKFANEMRKGLAVGETNAQLTARIVGTKNVPGVMPISRTKAAALVHSSVMTVANSARLATYRKNADIINGVQFLGTLDGNTCLECGVRDGMTWDLDGMALPGTDLPFKAPPLHKNCRCVLTPVMKPMSEISGGTLPDIIDRGTRASSGGQVSNKLKFVDWFKSRTVSQQNAQFGETKAQLFREGRLSLRSMLDETGKPLPLARLKEVVDAEQ